VDRFAGGDSRAEDQICLLKAMLQGVDPVSIDALVVSLREGLLLRSPGGPDRQQRSMTKTSMIKTEARRLCAGKAYSPLSSWNLRERRWENSIDFPPGRWASNFPFGRRFISSTHSRFRMC
jgi:hypothetical protein